MDSPAAARLRFIQDFYGPAYADLEADHVCCRDTLEHIGKVADFMRLIRRSIGDRADRRGLLRAPGYRARPGRGGVLGHLLRALLVL